MDTSNAYDLLRSINKVELLIHQEIEKNCVQILQKWTIKQVLWSTSSKCQKLPKTK